MKQKIAKDRLNEKHFQHMQAPQASFFSILRKSEPQKVPLYSNYYIYYTATEQCLPVNIKVLQILSPY